MATTKTIEQLLATIEQAKASNDAARMRAALDQAQKPLADMRDHMNMCMTKMGNMQGMGNMHGMGGMQGGAGAHDMSAGQQPGANRSGQEIDPVCKMKVDPETAPTATYQNQTYYFCSEADKAKFLKDPAAFAKPLK
jgi:YHS domain-containing protein